MTPATLLALADRLALGADETDWRSAVSRAYYAAFHAARSFLSRPGFTQPKKGSVHDYLVRRLGGATGHRDVLDAGYHLGRLRIERNKADYDLAWSITQPATATLVARARTIVNTLAAVEADPARLAAVVAAIRHDAVNIRKEAP